LAGSIKGTIFLKFSLVCKVIEITAILNNIKNNPRLNETIGNEDHNAVQQLQIPKGKKNRQYLQNCFLFSLSIITRNVKKIYIAGTIIKRF
jgi:hypothetical protein